MVERTPRLRLFNLALATVLVTGPIISEYPDRGEPLQDVALSSDLVEEGYRNGYLDDELLTEVESNLKKRRCFLETEAAEAWQQMAVHAAHDGILLEAGSCYRDYSTQVYTYGYNCPVTKIPVKRRVTTVDEDGVETTETVTRYITRRKCRVPTARPGNSNHGWGRAVDVSQRGRSLTCRTATFKWLKEHASQYGWVHPPWAGCRKRLEEAWHWEWAGTAEQPETYSGRFFKV